MPENELQILIKGIFSRIKEKYGYTDEQALIYLKGYEDCAEEHQQSLEKRDKMLRDTVTELCEAKRLLKAAVDDMKTLVRCDSVQDCLVCKYQLGDCDGFAFEWKHMEDVNNLINPIE